MPASFTTHVAPNRLELISVIASDTDTFSLTIGISFPMIIIASTFKSNCLPRLPPGWNNAKSSLVKLRFCRSVRASASPIANAAVVEEVGADRTGTLPFHTGVKNEIALPAQRRIQIAYHCGSLSHRVVEIEAEAGAVPAVSPLFDMHITTSSGVTMPKSP